MSRIGKKTITIPKDTSVILENTIIKVKGKYGILEQSISENLQVEISNDKILVKRKNDLKESKAYHGLIRALIQNMIIGVTKQFSKTLIAEGIGYKFQIENKKLILNMGFTHPIEFLIPDDITIKAESPTKIIIMGIDKQKVGFMSAKIKDIKPPEPYKGKGIMYEGEIIIRKAGKTKK